MKFFVDTFFPKKRKTRQQTLDDEQWQLEVSEDIAREIWAVVSLSIGILILLSLSNQLGLPGSWINEFLKPIFGWGLYILPALLLLTAGLLFLSKEIKITMAKITGAGLFLISLLSIFHLSVPEDKILEYAIAGNYGGYIGFITNWFFRIVLQVGNLGSSMIFVPTFLISLLLTFEVSIKEMVIKTFFPSKIVTPTKVRQKALIEADYEDEVEEELEEYYEEQDDELEDEINIIKPEILKPQLSSGKNKSKKAIIEDDEAETNFQEQETMFAEGTESNINVEDQTELEEEILEWATLC